MSNNHITKLHIPADANVPNLERIDLSNNELTELPKNVVDHFGGASFRLLDVSNNKLKELTDEFYILFEDKMLQMFVKRDPVPYARSGLLQQVQDPNW